MNLKPDWRTLLSSLLIVFAFPPWDFSPLIWVALIPWFLALERAGTKTNAFIQAVWFSFFMSIGGFYWVAHVLQQFGNLPWPLAILGLLLFALFNELQFLVFAPLFVSVQKYLRTCTSALWIVAAGLFSGLLYTGLDWILPKLFVDTLGHAFYASKLLRQSTDIGGPAILTLAVFLVNFSVWAFYSQLKKRQQPSIWPAFRMNIPHVIVSVVYVGSLLTYGYFREKFVTEQIDKTPRTVQLGVVQGNIGDFEKVAAERGFRGAGEKILETMFTLSDQALSTNPKLDALVWPETTYPSTFRTPDTAEELYRDQRVERFARERGVPILFGGYDHSSGKDYNAFFFLAPNGETGSDLQIYRKHILLLFGEYIPGSEQIKLIRQIFPQVANFGRGIGPEVLTIPNTTKKPKTDKVKVGPIICYEALFPNYIIAAARQGSQMILNITNDSWFGPYGEPQLHLALSAFRSIETRLPQVRSTNTGISALILPNGEIVQQTGVSKAEVMNLSVPILNPIPTLMISWGDWFGPTAFGLGIGFFASLYLLSWLAERRKLTQLLKT